MGGEGGSSGTETWTPGVPAPRLQSQPAAPQRGPACLLDLFSSKTQGHSRARNSFSSGIWWGSHGAQCSSVWCVLQFLGGLLATIFLDIVHISIFYPRVSLTDTGRFGAGMAILSLLLKPLSCCFVYHMYRERGGELLVHTGEATTSSQLPTLVSPLPGPQPLPQ